MWEELKHELVFTARFINQNGGTVSDSLFISFLQPEMSAGSSSSNSSSNSSSISSSNSSSISSSNSSSISSSNSSSISSSNSSSISSIPSLIYSCADCKASFQVALSVVLVDSALLLPLSCLVLHLGRRRVAAASHTDIFTYNMVVMEVFGCLGGMLYCLGFYMDLEMMLMIGVNLYFIAVPGRPFFHCLTCGERYLAVVHPITYRGLRDAGGAGGGVGVRLRNGSITCGWLLCAGWLWMLWISSNIWAVILICYFVTVLLLTSFFSLSVLHVLSALRPGEGGARERVDQSKRRAFHTVTAILATLLVNFVGLLGCVAVAISPLVSYHDACITRMASLWFCLPSSLVLPGLYLHRAGKVPGCRG